MSTQTVLLPEVEFEALLEAWERFLDALLDGNGAPPNSLSNERAEQLERAAQSSARPVFVLQLTGGVA